MHNRSLLGWVAFAGHEGLSSYYFGWKDVDPNFPNENDRMPLGCVAVSEHEGVVKLYKPGSLTVAKTGASAVAPCLLIRRGFARSRRKGEGGAEGG